MAYEDQFNLYAYVHNDPINRTDPTGTFGDIYPHFREDTNPFEDLGDFLIGDLVEAINKPSVKTISIAVVGSSPGGRAATSLFKVG